MIEQLPTEIILETLKKLPTNDLLSVSLVSKRFFELATDPLLWKRFKIEYATPEMLISKLKVPRFRKLQALHVSNCELMPFLEDESDEERRKFTKDELKMILELVTNIDLQDLRLSYLDLREIDKDLLSKVTTKTEMVSIEAEVDLDQDQILEIVKNISDGTLNCFQANQVDFRNIDPTILASAINSLESFAADLCHFNKEQIQAIFHKMAKETKLKDISLFLSNKRILEDISPSILSSAFNNLQNLYLGKGDLSQEQLFSIFEKMSAKTKLQRVFLTVSDTVPSLVQPIPAIILSKAINNLEVFIAPKFNFSQAQMKIILEEVAAETSKLKRLDLGFTEPLPDLSLSCLRAVMFKLENNYFKFQIQTKIIQVYDETIKNLRRELEEKEAVQESMNQIKKKLRRHSQILFRRIQQKVSKAFQVATDEGRIHRPKKHGSYRRFKSKSSGIASHKRLKMQIRIIRKVSRKF